MIIDLRIIPKENLGSIAILISMICYSAYFIEGYSGCAGLKFK